MEPQAGRRVSPFRVTKRSNDFLRKNPRRSRVHVQTIGLNAETKNCRHRADGEICLLTFPFIGLLWLLREAEILATWVHDGVPDDAVFDVAATIPMSRMQRGVVYKEPPFDIEEFIKQVEKRIERN